MINFSPPLSTPVGVTPLNPAIHLDAKMMLLGSCFSQNIGKKMVENKMDVLLNPYGIQYNPVSILSALKEMMVGKVYQSSDLVNHNDYYHSMMHHGDFSHHEEQTVLCQINEQLREGHARMACMDWLILTWGTAWVYELKENQHIVSNCHKIPSSLFLRRRLSVSEIVDGYVLLFEKLFAENPQVNVLFTVSPIRHLRDDVHENQLSKSILLLAQEILITRYPERIHYFPAYEILLDELRDYRFYDVDLTHPSMTAQQIIWSHFVQSCFDKKMQKFLDIWTPILKQLEHKPFDAKSASYQSFLSQLLSKVITISEKFSSLNFLDEIQKIKCYIQ
ncbi:MAG: GSCFA domain-containing protein [Bacteroidaceae bacterium]